MPRKMKTAQERTVKLVFQQIKNNARTRNLSFNITEACVETHIFQPCSYCGAGLSCAKQIPITRSKGSRVRYRDEKVKYNSMDRVNNQRGYEPNNMTTACLICQIAKNDLSLIEFLALIARLGQKLEAIRNLGRVNQ